MTETHHHPATSPGGGADRRSFFGWLSAGVLALAGALSGVIGLLYLRPRVTFGSASKVQVGKPTAFAPGSVMEFPEERIVIRRDGDRVAAISTVCTHLGCTVKATEVGFDCPCHGSQYDERGNVVGGPAPEALSWYRVALAPNGELEVNKQEVVPASTYLDLGMRV